MEVQGRHEWNLEVDVDASHSITAKESFKVSLICVASISSAIDEQKSFDANSLTH